MRTGEDEEKDTVPDIRLEKLDDSSTDDTDYVTDIPEDSIDKKLKIPSYKHCKANQISIGRSFVSEVTGYHCEKCRRFMLTEDDMLAHLRTVSHYRNFIQEIKALQAAAKAASEKDEEKDEVGFCGYLRFYSNCYSFLIVLSCTLNQNQIFFKFTCQNQIIRTITND